MVPIRVRDRDRGPDIADTGFGQVQPPVVVHPNPVTSASVGEQVGAGGAGQSRLGRAASLNPHFDAEGLKLQVGRVPHDHRDRKSTRLNSSHLVISYAVFCLKKKKSKWIDYIHTRTDSAVRDI